MDAIGSRRSRSEKRVARLDMPGASFFWIAAERLPQFRAVWPSPRSSRLIVPPTTLASQEWTREERSRRNRARPAGRAGTGHATALGARSSLAPAAIAAALAALEAEGFALRGRFPPDAAEDEWCERRLLARIHHYTLKRLRAEIEPVAARDFLRFLFAWQQVAAETHMEGPEALDTVLRPAGRLRSAGRRLGDRDPAGAARRLRTAWLDDRCLAGRIAWARLEPRIARRRQRHGRAAPVRTTPDRALAAPASPGSVDVAIAADR